MSAVDWLMLVSLSVLWGGSFFFAKIAVAELPPLTSRSGASRSRRRSCSRSRARPAWRLPDRWGPFLVMGLLNNALPFSLIFWGQTHIPSGLAAILNATTPLFTVLVAHFATADEKLTAARLAGVAAGFAGVVVMIGPDLLRELGTNVAAQLACLARGGQLCVRRHLWPALPRRAGAARRRRPARRIERAARADRHRARPALACSRRRARTAWAALVALAALSTALGYLIYFRILARAGATNVLLVTFLIPVSAILLGTLLLGEQLAARHIVGMAAIALGLAVIDGRALRLLPGHRL